MRRIINKLECNMYFGGLIQIPVLFFVGVWIHVFKTSFKLGSGHAKKKMPIRARLK
jgi:hypothetical protein